MNELDKPDKDQIKVRFKLSDGESKATAVMTKDVVDQLEAIGMEIQDFDILQIGTYSFINNKEKVINLKTPPAIVRSGLAVKIGLPKDYAENVANKVFAR